MSYIVSEVKLVDLRREKGIFLRSHSKAFLCNSLFVCDTQLLARKAIEHLMMKNSYEETDTATFLNGH